MAKLQAKKMSSTELARQEGAIMLGKQLVRACRFGDVNLASSLLARGADVNYRSVANESPIYAAAGRGDVPLLDCLLKAGVNIDVKTDSKQMPIHNAAASGSVQAISWLIQRGAQLSAQTYDGSTALHVAVQCYHLHAVAWFITSQSKSTSKSLFNKQDFYGENVGHVAVKLLRLPRRLDMLELLLAGGVDLNQQNEQGDTVLHRAASGPANPLVLAWIVANGGKIGCPMCGKGPEPCKRVQAPVAEFLRELVAAQKRNPELNKSNSAALLKFLDSSKGRSNSFTEAKRTVTHYKSSPALPIGDRLTASLSAPSSPATSPGSEHSPLSVSVPSASASARSAPSSPALLREGIPKTMSEESPSARKEKKEKTERKEKKEKKHKHSGGRRLPPDPASAVRKADALEKRRSIAM